jgi:hypothetical protein
MKEIDQIRRAIKMAGFQFAHVDSFALKAAKGKTGGHSVRSIIAEAQREPGACDHVPEPLPPTLHHGVPVSELEGLCTEYAATMKDAKGRKMRADGLCLMAGVVSCPPGAEGESWEKIRGESIEWLKERYGERLRSVIEHKDEEHPHIHWYVIPLPGERFDAVHEGKRAAAEANAKGLAKGEQNSAYKAAMRSWQDSYFDAVGVQNGLTRIGPGRRRLSRDEWKQEQHSVELVAQKLEHASTLEAAAEQALEAAPAVVEAIKAEAMAEAQRVREKAVKDADKAVAEAREQGRSEAIAEFGKSSLWAKLTGLLSKKDTEISALKTEVKDLRKDLNSARSETKKTKGLMASIKAAGKRIAEQFQGLEGERDRAVSRAQKAERQRDQLRIDLAEVREDRIDVAVVRSERDFERARADAAERKVAVLEGSTRPVAPFASGGRKAQVEEYN